MEQLTEVQQFVNRFYTNVLEREADVSGLEYWSNSLESKTQTADDIAMGFFNSEEFLNKNVSNSEFINISYKTILGREADAEGKAYWVNN